MVVSRKDASETPDLDLSSLINHHSIRVVSCCIDELYPNLQVSGFITQASQPAQLYAATSVSSIILLNGLGILKKTVQ